jgi:hypothetical protein
VGDHDHAEDDAQNQQREGLKTIEIAQEIPPIQKIIVSAERCGVENREIGAGCRETAAVPRYTVLDTIYCNA